MALRARGQLVGLLHLRQNLRLADDHAVEAGGHREQVPHEVFARALEQVVEDLQRRQAVELGQERHRVVVRRAGLRRLAGEVQLHAVARRKQHRLRLGIAAAEPGQRLRRLVAAERQPLADLHRRRVMAAADHLELHAPASWSRRRSAWSRIQSSECRMQKLMRCCDF